MFTTAVLLPRQGSRSERRAARKQRKMSAGGIAEGSALQNGSLNSFLQSDSSRLVRSRSAVRRQVPLPLPGPGGYAS